MMTARERRMHTFMRTIVFQDLPVAERDRLKRQFAFMDGYSEVLGERIVNF